MDWIDIHVATLSVLALVIVYSDINALLYLLGKKSVLSEKMVRIEHRVVWSGLALMILSGGAMFLPGWQYYIHEPAFLVKMTFVGALIINGFLIGKIASQASVAPFKELEPAVQKRMLISGAVSTLAWVGAATIGFFFL